MSLPFGFTRRQGVLMGLALGLGALPGRAHASLVLALELPAMTAAADAIVVAKVAATRSWKAQNEKTIFTEIKLEVAETWKGISLAGTRTITIVQPGGTVGDLEMHVHGLPRFSQGEDAVLFLNARDPQRPGLGFILTALGQGRRRLFRDGEGRVMAAPGDRSAAVLKDALGRWQSAPPEPAVPLDDLRQQVRLLLEAQR